MNKKVDQMDVKIVQTDKKIVQMETKIVQCCGSAEVIRGGGQGGLQARGRRQT